MITETQHTDVPKAFYSLAVSLTVSVSVSQAFI